MTTKITSGIYRQGNKFLGRYVDADGKFLGFTMGQAVRAMAARKPSGRRAMTIGEQYRLALAGA